MIRGFILGLVVMMALVHPAAAADTQQASVEVHVNDSDLLLVFACWPADFEVQPEKAMIVYIQFPDGIAGYNCTYDGGAWIKSLLPVLPLKRA